MRRSLPLLCAVLGATLLLSACGSGGSAGPAAAKVDSTTITRAELDDQLEVLASNTKWLKAIAPDFGDETMAAPNGNVKAPLAAAWLTALMNQAVVDRGFERRNLTVSDQNREDALTAAKGLFNTPEGSTWETLPKWFRDDFLAGQERYEAVRGTLPALEPTEADLERTVESSKLQFCQAGDAVSHILVDSQAAADAIEAELARGVAFDDLVERSTDEGTRGRGGFLSCNGSPNWNQLPEDFRQAVAAVPVGGISAPIQTEFGFHVVRVTPYDLASLRPLFETLYQQSLQPPINQYVNNRLLDAKIWVDPRYGTLGRGPVRVNPPKAPTPRNEPPIPGSTAPAGATGS